MRRPTKRPLVAVASTAALVLTIGVAPASAVTPAITVGSPVTLIGKSVVKVPVTITCGPGTVQSASIDVTVSNQPVVLLRLRLEAASSSASAAPPPVSQ